MLFINTSKIRESTVGSSFTVTYSANPESVEELKTLHSTYSSVNMSEFTLEPKTEPHHSGEVTEMVELQKCYLRKSCDHYGDKQVCGRCREYNLYSHTKDEPQTDYRITDTIGYRCPKCGRGNFLSNESNCVYCGEPLIKTDCHWK